MTPHIRNVSPSWFGSQVCEPDQRRLPYGTFLLYKAYDSDGSVLYIGITGRPEERFTSHRRKAEWWSQMAAISTETFFSLREALAAERACIREESPMFNVRSVSV